MNQCITLKFDRNENQCLTLNPSPSLTWEKRKTANAWAKVDESLGYEGKKWFYQQILSLYKISNNNLKSGTHWPFIAL